MKYRLTENSVEYKGKTLYQIESLTDFEITTGFGFQVKKGDLGGYIESESNLSQQGNCWIGENVYVLDNAKIENNAFIDCVCIVQDNSRVFEQAYIEDGGLKTYRTNISGQAQIYGNAFIYKTILTVCDNAKIYGSAQANHTQLSLSGNAAFSGGKIDHFDAKKGHIHLRENAEICGGWLSGNCSVYGNAKILGGGLHDNAEIFGNAKIYDSDICGNATVEGNVEIHFDTNINDNAYLCGNARVERDEDVMTFSNIGTLALLQNEEIEEMKYLTFFRVGDKVQMTIGRRFYDDPEKFLQDMQLFNQNLQAIVEMAEQRFVGNRGN